MTTKVLTAAAVARLKPAAQRIEINDAAAPGLFLVQTAVRQQVVGDEDSAAAATNTAS